MVAEKLITRKQDMHAPGYWTNLIRSGGPFSPNRVFLYRFAEFGNCLTILHHNKFGSYPFWDEQNQHPSANPCDGIRLLWIIPFPWQFPGNKDSREKFDKEFRICCYLSLITLSKLQILSLDMARRSITGVLAGGRSQCISGSRFPPCSHNPRSSLEPHNSDVGYICRMNFRDPDCRILLINSEML